MTGDGGLPIQARSRWRGRSPSALSSPEPRAPSPDTYASVHRCLLSGWPTQVGLKDEKSQYRGTRERKFQIFPASTLAKRPPRWLLAGQILDLQKVYAMLCAEVVPEWIEQQAAHLVKRNWRDAHWSRKRGAVLAFEQVTLFGLVLVEKRTVQFGRQDPATAHEVFLREALVRCDIDCRADCVRANARVLAQAYEVEAKQRRSGLVRDEDELIAFFRGKLPVDIDTAAAFDAWYRKASPAEQAALRWSLADVLTDTPGMRAGDFPTHLDCAGHSLRLDYRFVPGDAADGVTLNVPLAFVNAVPTARCEWLVPGLLAEKVAELIRGLPKALRRNFVPAPDFARAFAQAEAARDEALAGALAAYLRRVTGVEIGARDFDGMELPPHLRMRFRVFDDRVDQSVLDQGRLDQSRTDQSRSTSTDQRDGVVMSKVGASRLPKGAISKRFGCSGAAPRMRRSRVAPTRSSRARRSSISISKRFPNASSARKAWLRSRPSSISAIASRCGSTNAGTKHVPRTSTACAGCCVVRCRKRSSRRAGSCPAPAR